MGVLVNMVLAYSQTTSKLQLQNNHHSELLEIWLNGSPTTTELKKPHGD